MKHSQRRAFIADAKRRDRKMYPDDMYANSVEISKRIAKAAESTAAQIERIADMLDEVKKDLDKIGEGSVDFFYQVGKKMGL